MKKKILFLVLLSLSLASGFSMTTRIVDDIYMVMIVGYDYLDENLIKGTVVAPSYKADKSIENITFSDTARLIYENRDKLEAKSPRPLISGKLETALYNRELAEKGLIEYVDNLQRDPVVGARVLLAIFEGSTEKLLEKQFEEKPTGAHFANVMDQNVLYDNLPVTNLHTFGFQYFSQGIDPILPLLAEEDDEKETTTVKIKGLALFKDDKMVADIPKKDFIYFRSLYEHFDNGVLYINLEDDERAFLTTVESSKKVTVKNNQKEFNPKITISMKLQGIIREYSGKELTGKKIRKIEQQINEDIEKNSKELIKKFQELNIDPLGIGKHSRNRTRNWDQKRWEDLYPNLDISVKADFTILEHGIIK